MVKRDEMTDEESSYRKVLSSRPWTIKLTGRVFDDKERIEKDAEPLALEVRRLCEEGRPVIVVTGGGKRLREVVGVLRSSGVGEGWLDMLGIEFSRLNARLMSLLIGADLCPEVPRDAQASFKLLIERGCTCMGGVSPGFSTSAVAAMMAEISRSEVLIVMTDVGGVYDADPEREPRASMLREVTVSELRGILAEERRRAAHYPLMDEVALEIIQRSKIRTCVTKPRAECLKELREGKCEGTWILPE